MLSQIRRDALLHTIPVLGCGATFDLQHIVETINRPPRRAKALVAKTSCRSPEEAKKVTAAMSKNSALLLPDSVARGRATTLAPAVSSRPVIVTVAADPSSRIAICMNASEQWANPPPPRSVELSAAMLWELWAFWQRVRAILARLICL